MFETLKQWIQKAAGHNGEKEEKIDKADKLNKSAKLGLMQWVIILIGIGLAMMILYDYFQDHGLALGESEPEPDIIVEDYEHVMGQANKGSSSGMQEYEQYLENQLKDILSLVHGVGAVTVMINLDATEEVVYEKNINTRSSQTDEQDREGGSRQVEDLTKDDQVVVLRQGNNEKPIVIKTKKPKVRGVLVVASGAEHMQVKAWITEAVGRVLDVPVHRVSVLPRKDE